MSEIRVKPTLRSTKDYNLFEPHPYNREISRTKVLERSMRKFGFDNGLPIRCVRNGSDKLKITHGHHRFHVARSLGLPIWFIVASEDIPLFESEASTHAWNVKDYTVARARAGEQSAETVLQYHQQTGIPIGPCISLIGGESASSGNMGIGMKHGKFKVGDTKRADQIAVIVKHCVDCGVDFARNSLFVKALSKCIFVEEFDIDLFMHKVSTHKAVMEKRRGVDDYMDLIEFVYNRQSQVKIPLRFLANQAAERRQHG